MSLSRSFDHLGNLGAKLRDLQGYGTLAYELIQNADDAPAYWMSFDIQQDALVLDNDGVFADCAHVEVAECPWSNDGVHDHRCDFHRFRSIGSGDKRFQDGTTGAFGIGFIAVYQLTDQPELISRGRHWIVHEERNEHERIDVCAGCPSCEQPDLPGTRFILPFAREQQSPLRQALKAEPVSQDVTTRLLQELERSLPVAMLFLKNLSAIEIKSDNGLRRRFERESDDDTLIISQGASSTDGVWHLLRGNFHDEAADLRREHAGRIEDKRSAEVAIALPAKEASTGLLCACLPTEDSPGLPFHVNADFFPSNDRKHVILGDDYQAKWNRAALLAAARTVAEAAPRLTRMLGAEYFWHIASDLNALAINAQKDGRDRVWMGFWRALEVALRQQAVVLTSTQDWATPSSGVTVLQQSEEANHIPLLEDLGIKLASESLRPYQTMLRSVGVPVFDVETLCSALRANGLFKPIGLAELPRCLTSKKGRAALWTEIAILLRRQGSNPHAKHTDENRLRAVALAPTIGKALRPCQEVFRADSSTVHLFASLGLEIPFLDQSEEAFQPLSYLCDELEAADAILALETCDIASVQRLWMEGHLSLQKLIGWFESRREQIFGDEDMSDRLAALPIYPSAGQFHPLTSLVLPGNFEDPLSLTSLVDVEALQGRREFLVDLGVAELDFRTYVLEHLSQALDDEELAPTVREEAMTLLADHLGELIDDDELHQVLSPIRLVRCRDGQYHRAADCYFPDDVIEEVLGTDAKVAVLPEDHKASLRGLLEWLGVASGPRLRDIVRTVYQLAEESCSPTGVVRIQKIMKHLGQRFKDIEDLSELEPLQSIEWLPARGDRKQWHDPDSLYAPYRSYLFESQGGVLDILAPDGDLLEFLGVNIEPPADLVVRHLLHCAERDKPVNTEVYRFLNDKADDPVIERLRSKKCLWLGQAYRSPSHVFWGDHRFGRYRWRLADDLRGYGRLLDRIGVIDTPNHEDALGVLSEISLEFGHANAPLDDEAYGVLMGCWQMLEEALEAGALSVDLLETLNNTKAIPNKARVPYVPTWLFFENRAGLAAKFGTFLANNVISRPLRTGRAFLAAGVRQLGSAVEPELLRNDNPADDPNTREMLHRRRNEVARVLASRMPSGEVQNALNRLRDLECSSAASLVIQYRLDAFDRVVKSQAESALALYQPASHRLWTSHTNGQLPWAHVARELAVALCPDEDPGLFAAGLKEVLAAKTEDEASTALDELGFPQLDTTVVEPPHSQEVADHLGIAVSVDEGEPPSDSTQDEWQSGMNSEDETGTLSPEDALRSLGLTQDPTSPVPESPEPTTAPGHSNGGDIATNKAGAPGGSPVKSGKGGASPGSGRRTLSPEGRKFFSYVALSPESEEESDPDGLTREERMKLEDDAIALILEDEPELERTPTNNPGFDLTEPGPDGQPVRWVEVKAMKGTLRDRPVGLSRTQFDCSREHGEAFWLYVVEGAGIPEEARVLRIQDPAGSAETFTFDHGWTAVADGAGGDESGNHS